MILARLKQPQDGQPLSSATPKLKGVSGHAINGARGSRACYKCLHSTLGALHSLHQVPRRTKGTPASPDLMNKVPGTHIPISHTHGRCLVARPSHNSQSPKSAPFCQVLHMVLTGNPPRSPSGCDSEGMGSARLALGKPLSSAR